MTTQEARPPPSAMLAMERALATERILFQATLKDESTVMIADYRLTTEARAWLVLWQGFAGQDWPADICGNVISRLQHGQTRQQVWLFTTEREAVRLCNELWGLHAPEVEVH